MKILITGCAGFIGFSLAHKLLQNKSNTIIGIDNIDNYYDIKIKKDRLNKLKKFNNFKFLKVDICNKKKIEKVFKNYKNIKVVINLAAQAGVRYSFINPDKYIDVNIKGFFNMIDISKKYKINLFLFASSSSVYGDNKSKKLKENDNTIKPISLYGATKLSNEIIAYTYAKLFRLNSVGLRFFTVYGPWGRPDMSLNQFVKNIISNKKIHLYNGGDHIRDFTYIDDIINGIAKVINKKINIKKQKVPFQILNIASSRPVKLKYYLKLIEEKLVKKSVIRLLPLQKGDIRKTHGDTTEIRKFGYRPKTKIEKGISNFVDWYKSYYK